MGTEKKIIKSKYKNYSEIEFSIARLSKKINKDYKKSDGILFIVVMKGGIFFAIDLLKKIKIDCEMDFIFSNSYNKNEKMHEPIISYNPTIDPKDKRVIIIDDLIDSGDTLRNVIKLVEEKEPKDIAIATIFGDEKWEVEKVKKYYLFKENKKGFLVGYGLDYEEKYRNLTYISTIK